MRADRKTRGRRSNLPRVGFRKLPREPQLEIHCQEPGQLQALWLQGSIGASLPSLSPTLYCDTPRQDQIHLGPQGGPGPQPTTASGTQEVFV